MWTAQEAADAFTASMAVPIPVPGDFLRAYGDVRSYGDDACPGPDYGFEDLGGCTADSGWWYLGLFGYEMTDTADQEEDFLFADGQIVGPDGRRLAIGGSVWAQMRYVDKVAVGGVGYFAALMLDDGESSNFDPPVDALLTFTAERREPKATSMLDGPLEYVGGVLDFDQLTFNGDTCDGDGVTGSVRLRDDAGRWYDFALGDDCDACGEVTGPDGTSLGEACADVGDVGDDLAERYLTPWR